MSHITAQPPVAKPSTYVPPEIKLVFKALLDSIAVSDERHGTSTPSATLLLIMAAARRLGVSPAELVNDEADS